MANVKISGLTAIDGATLASTDLIPVVDVSDTTMAGSGTSKKTTVAGLATAIAAAGSLATDAEVAAGYQPLDSDLTAIALLTTTVFGRAFLALADGAALRAVLGTGTPSSGTFLDGSGAWSAPPPPIPDAVLVTLI